MLRRVAIRGIHLHALFIVMVWWLLYADHRAVFEVRRISFIRRIRSVSGDVGCLHMLVDLKVENLSGSAMRVMRAS